MNIINFKCMVGGLPVRREFPFQYKAPFSPVDVIEEYTRPARFKINGKLVTKPALSDAELDDFDGIGTLEAFNSDGLRSLLHTIPAENMVEKTLRYPGHLESIKILNESGFFAKDAIDINGIGIKPVEFTSKILFKKWKLEMNDDEFTVMRIIIDGIENEKNIRYQYDLLDRVSCIGDRVSDSKTQNSRPQTQKPQWDRLNKDSGISSMARTTGYTCTAAVNLLLEGLFTQTGIIPPEYIGMNAHCFDFIFNYLIERNVIYRVVKS